MNAISGAHQYNFLSYKARVDQFTFRGLLIYFRAVASQQHLEKCCGISFPRSGTPSLSIRLDDRESPSEGNCVRKEVE